MDKLVSSQLSLYLGMLDLGNKRIKSKCVNKMQKVNDTFDVYFTWETPGIRVKATGRVLCLPRFALVVGLEPLSTITVYESTSTTLRSRIQGAFESNMLYAIHLEKL